MRIVILIVSLIVGVVINTFGQNISRTYNFKIEGIEFIEMKSKADFLYNDINKTIQISYIKSGNTYWKVPQKVTNVIKINDDRTAFEISEGKLKFYVVMDDKKHMLKIPVVLDGFQESKFVLINI